MTWTEQRPAVKVLGLVLAVLLAQIILLDWSYMHGRGDVYPLALKCVVQTDSIIHAKGP